MGAYPDAALRMRDTLVCLPGATAPCSLVRSMLPKARSLLVNPALSVTPLRGGRRKSSCRTSRTSPLTGYTIITAESLADATEKAKGCPVLATGGSIEVYETLPVG